MQLAQLISIFGHPIFMPLYAFITLTYTNPYINMMIPEANKNFILGVIVVFTIILPLFTAVIFKLFGLIDDLFMKTAKERRLPFFLTIFWYYLSYLMLTKIYVPHSFLLIMVGAICAICIASLITIRWKISIHMLGIGGVIGAIIAISQRFQFNHSLLIICLILFAGLIGYARLKTNSHNYRQVYSGFILGLAIEWVCVMNF